MRKTLLMIALGAVSTVAGAQHAGPARLETSGALFGVREAVEAIDLSPSGTRVVYVAPGPGRTSEVYVADLAAGTQQLVIRSDGKPERLRGCGFVNEQRLVCTMAGIVDSAGVLLPFSRLFAIDTDGGNAKPLGQRGSVYDARLRQFDGAILDWLPGDGKAVLMARDYVPEEGKQNTRIARQQNGMGVDRIDVDTLASTPVEAPNKIVDGFVTDGQGNVRIRASTPNRGATGQQAGHVNFFYRLEGAKEWREFSTWDGDSGMLPLAVDAGSDSAYVLRKLDGRLALYRVKLDGSLATELVYKHDRVDVDDVVRAGRGGRVIGVTYAEDMRHVVYFDQEYSKLAAALGKAIPDLPLIDFLGASRDGSTLLIHADSDVDPGRYYVFDRGSRALKEIMLARPALEHVPLARVRAVTYPAADGTAIPAYLTLPPGKDTARGLPAVVLPHGGPSARDEWGFDWLAQYLAHEGYAVLQPNYRGSAGFGDGWLRENGIRSWSTSIGDVVSAGEWMVAQGIADPARLAIVGWSYGGYAALQANVVEPTLFKAAVAIAPVTDLAMLKDDSRNYTNWSNTIDMIGSGPHVAAGSPARHASRITAPVLMFHGSLDVNVALRQSRTMESALRSAGRQVELVEYEGLAHDLADSNARALMLDRIGAFLRTSLAK